MIGILAQYELRDTRHIIKLENEQPAVAHRYFRTCQFHFGETDARSFLFSFLTDTSEILADVPKFILHVCLKYTSILY